MTVQRRFFSLLILLPGLFFTGSIHARVAPVGPAVIAQLQSTKTPAGENRDKLSGVNSRTGQKSSSSSEWLGPVIGLLILLAFVLLFGTALARKRQRLREEIGTEKAEALKEAAKKETKRAPAAEKIKTKAAKLPEKAERERLREPVAEPVAPADAAEEVGATMREGLAKTQKDGFVARLGRLFKGKDFDESLLDELEEVLFSADIGVKMAQHLLDTVKDKLSRKEIKDYATVWQALKSETLAVLKGSQPEACELASKKPYVLLVVGVNGSGKTTTIGKLAYQFHRAGKTVLLAAGDTFRAAAVEQLCIWGERVGVPVHKAKAKADPASVIFDAVRRAADDGVDVVIADTAGRLHTAANLMEELRKISRVIKKVVDDAPHDVYLVLDSTMGQNSIQQATQFKDTMGVSGIVLTKLDGTAKGGVILAISKELGIPIRYVGLGEKLLDLRVFDSQEFVDALFDDVPIGAEA